VEIQFSYIVTLYLLSAVATAALALLCRYRWKSPAAPYFTLLFAAATLWNLGDAGEFMSITPAAKFLWVCVEYPGMAIVPVAWFLILLYYTGNSRLITKKTLPLLLAVPVFTVAAVVTNPFHHLYYKEIISVLEQGTFVGIYLHGPLFWIFIAYSYGLLLFGFALIIARFWGSHAIYRAQAFLILLATAIPLFANLLYNTGGGPIPHVNFTPLLFVLSVPVAHAGGARPGLCHDCRWHRRGGRPGGDLRHKPGCRTHAWRIPGPVDCAACTGSTTRGDE